LAEYEKVMPGLGKRIIENLLEQAEQRQENEKALVKTIPRGQHYALTVVVLVICLAGVLAYLHYPWAAALIVSLDLAMMVGAFLRGPSSFEALFKALERKSEEKKKLLESMKE
jgi:cytochrome c-type biogenesis protein CcmH/NrfG